jgi:hypothetical protein
MIDLLAVGKSWDLLSDNAAQRQKHPIAIGSGKCIPDFFQGNSLIWLQPARGGTGLGFVCRMMILRARLVPGESESNPPTSGVPEPQLWRLEPRIDNAELQAWSVCFFCNVYKGPNLAGLDPATGKITRLYHPRRHRWTYHFRFDGSTLVGRTAIGRTTIDVLQINHPKLIALRGILMEAGVF